MEEKTQFTQAAQPVTPPDTTVEIKEEIVPFTPVQAKRTFPLWIVLVGVGMLVLAGGIFFLWQTTQAPVEENVIPTPFATVRPTPDQVEDLFLQRPALPTPFVSTPSATHIPTGTPSAEVATLSGVASQSALPQ